MQVSELLHAVLSVKMAHHEKMTLVRRQSQRHLHGQLADAYLKAASVFLTFLKLLCDNLTHCLGRNAAEEPIHQVHLFSVWAYGILGRSMLILWYSCLLRSHSSDLLLRSLFQSKFSWCLYSENKVFFKADFLWSKSFLHTTCKYSCQGKLKIKIKDFSTVIVTQTWDPRLDLQQLQAGWIFLQAHHIRRVYSHRQQHRLSATLSWLL